MGDPLDLQSIRKILMRLEDTITFLMIERAQFAHNKIIYECSSKFIELERDSNEASFLGWMLKQTEITHAKVRRYESPDEYPFTPRNELPLPILPPIDFPKVLYPNQININHIIKDFYITNIVPILTKREGRPDDDTHYGSSATRDVEILQAVSRRIHYGKFVAESKFRDEPWKFVTLIQEKKSEEIERLITKPAVEATLIERLSKKALTYGQEISNEINHHHHHDQSSQQMNDASSHANHKLDAKVVVEMYRDWVIPLTRKVEVDYLLCRLDGLSQDEIIKLSKPPVK